MNKNKLIGILMLVFCTIIWGAAFSFQTMAKDYIGPFSLISIRFLLASVVLLPIVIFYVKKTKVCIDYKKCIVGGLITGAFLAFASIVQQFGIQNTSTGKAGFLTAMYIIFVPLISVIIFKKKLTVYQILGILITLVGVGLLSLNENFSINIGDILCLIAALLFAGQILSIERFNKIDSMVLAETTFFFTGIISLVFAFIFEDTTIEDIGNAIIPILFLGIASSAIAYTLQFLGQKRISGVPAALIMSLEAVFSAIFAFVLLGELLNVKELIGAILMMIGVVIVQVFDKNISFNVKDS